MKQITNSHKMQLRTVAYSNKYKRQCIDLMSATWNYNKYYPGLKRHNLINKLYFEAAIIGENYSQVIIDENDNVHGCIFGKIPGRRNHFLANTGRVATLTLKAFYHTLAGHFGSRSKSLVQMWRHLEGEKILLEKRKKSDAYAHLFIVSSSLRGQGWGKRLMNSLTYASKKYGANRVYLYTDLGCNYKFYDHYGFSVVKKINSPHYENPEAEFNAFAYAIKL